jgi:hypothetical protein
MLREYQLTNFKAFAGPETIPIRPITLIYGPNSSGKSSILQALLLLKQTLEEADGSTVLLPKGRLIDLGNYREFVHRHDMSKKFSFKVFFTLDPEKIDSKWVKKLLQATDSALVGLKVDFVYDEKTETIRFSAVDVFIGDKALPAISYAPSKFEEKEVPGAVIGESSLFARQGSSAGILSPLGFNRFAEKELLGAETETQIRREHNFWLTWWNVTKEHFAGEVTRSSAESVFYENEDERFKRLLKDLRNYPFEKAIEDLQKEENLWSWIGYRHFLPVIWAEKFKVVPKVVSHEESESEASEAEVEKEIQTTETLSPFTVHLFDSSEFFFGKLEGGLDVSPVALQVCSVFSQLVKNMLYLGPLRSYPERYYTFTGHLGEQMGQSGERLPDILFRRPELMNQVNTDLARLGFGYELKLSVLRDENCGLSNVFALRVVDKEMGVSANIRDVGFGVSQVLPIIVQSRLSVNKTLLIEQPEIHLHPAHQAELGDVFIQSALGEQKNIFILETHSEHLMLRILRRIRETAEGELEPGLMPIRPEHVAVLYVLPDKDGAKVVEIPIRPDGEFAEQWPQGFFAERAKELF